MSDLSTKYKPREVEDKWYERWMEKGFFHSTPNPEKEPYTIVIPPPNVTGILHMGHILNNTIQDILIRKARMEGKEACWVPGTDHASIATEAKVVAMLKEKGITKKDISREKFLNYAWEWKEKYGGIILQQLKKLGCSCDWERTRFTMEEDLSNAVIHAFVQLYNKGLIYRGYRMINWDPEGKTAVSDEEVIHKEVQSKLYYVKYKIVDSENYLTIATTRPETILADTAVCINPKDVRYKHLKGKRIIVPMADREVPVIEDEYVSMEFGTGCLKITPAHDENDYEIGRKHDLEIIDILNDDGSLNEKAGFYVGEDRFTARKKIEKDLKKLGLLEKLEDYVNQIGTSERTGAVVEPKLSMQWFMDMQKLSAPALDNVLNDNIQFHPPKFKNLYRNWMENIRDWCISRQLWWGQQIPAYYLPDGKFVVAETKEKALEIAKNENPEIKIGDLVQDEDVLDTWASSWLWPISVFDGFKNPDNKDIRYYYPTTTLVTAPEILFFWVARMIMAGYEFRGRKPFSHVYLTGIVRDKLGRKMSKSLGNSPDALELIEKYGADGVRTGMLFSAPAGNDLLFDIKLCEQGRNFANKIWNAFRLVRNWKVDSGMENNDNEIAVKWFESKFNQSLKELEDQFAKFRISDALMTIYRLIWEDFCSRYLEMIKPPFGGKIDEKIHTKTIQIFERLMKVLHPFMPFLSEEIWHKIRNRSADDYIIVSDWPKPGKVDQHLIDIANRSFEIISQIRKFRNTKNVSPKSDLKLIIKSEDRRYSDFEPFIGKLANLKEINYVMEKIDKSASFMIGTDEFYIPVDNEVDIEKQRAEIQKKLEYQKGFLDSVMRKLKNDRFVKNAPADVVETEKRKRDDAQAKIKVLEESLENLDGG